jgi:hypothetical protein
MKRNEIKVGREYVVKVGGKYGFTAKETVLGFEGTTVITRGGYGERCKRSTRQLVQAVELSPERSMDLLVAFVDGFNAVPHTSPEHLEIAVKALTAKPQVVAYTADEFGLPLLAPRAETEAERRQRIYSEAMARS